MLALHRIAFLRCPASFFDVQRRGNTIPERLPKGSPKGSTPSAGFCSCKSLPPFPAFRSVPRCLYATLIHGQRKTAPGGRARSVREPRGPAGQGKTFELFRQRSVSLVPSPTTSLFPREPQSLGGCRSCSSTQPRNCWSRPLLPRTDKLACCPSSLWIS